MGSVLGRSAARGPRSYDGLVRINEDAFISIQYANLGCKLASLNNFLYVCIVAEEFPLMVI